MLNEQIHEFWLEDYPVPGKNDEFYRVALGELINAVDRLTYKASWGPDCHTQSGSVGFMDLTIRDQKVPKQGAVPYPNPDHNFYMQHQYPWGEYEVKKALTILCIGIEPHHRGKIDNVRVLYQRAEQLALEWGLDIIVAEMIESRGVRKILPRLGYTLFDRGVNAVKRLEVSIS